MPVYFQIEADWWIMMNKSNRIRIKRRRIERHWVLNRFTIQAMTMKVVAEIMYYINNRMRKRYKCPHGGQEIPLKKRGSQCVFQSAMEWSYKRLYLLIEYHPGGGVRSGDFVWKGSRFLGKAENWRHFLTVRRVMKRYLLLLCFCSIIYGSYAGMLPRTLQHSSAKQQ